MVVIPHLSRMGKNQCFERIFRAIIEQEASPIVFES